MKSVHKTLLPMALLSLSLATLPLSVVAQVNPSVGVYPAPYVGLRELVDRTQNDLRTSGDLQEGNGKQRERYRNAQEHLSNFDRRLIKGKFDKGELDKSIGEIKGILDRNVLQASSRDQLLRDLQDLRMVRERRD